MRKLQVLFLFTFLLSIGFQSALQAQGSASAGKHPQFVFHKHYRIDGVASPVTEIGDSLGTIYFKAMTVAGTKFTTGSSIQSRITGPFDDLNLPSNLIFRTGSGQQLDRMVVTHDGLVGIGTLTPSFNLHTVGNTHTTGDFFGRIHFDDNQTTDEAPNTYIDEAYFELKQRNILGLPVGLGSHGGLLSLAPGGGSFDHQLFFAEDGIFSRRWNGDAASWAGSTWYKLLTSEDINGTENQVAKFTGPHSLGDSQLFDDGTQVGIGTSTPTAGFFMDINGNTIVNGAGHFTGTLNVDDNATLNQNLSVGNDAGISGDLTVNGTASVTGNTSLSQNLSVGIDVSIGDDLNVNNDANIGANLDVGGTAHIDGKVSIGTNNTPGGHELYVGGSMIAEEVVVKLETNWPDYIFTNNEMPNLAEWEKFIAKNKHLPGIPSAKEVQEKGGIELGETQRLLLEKIEQLTLIIIDQQKQIDALKEKK